MQKGMQLPPVEISIVCSVYNNEKYLEKCVDSILGQTLPDIELILIDNGCSDRSPEIIDNYAKKDHRVRVIHHLPGTSYGKSLNQGIALARGEYVGIVESDDFIHPDMYRKLYKKIKEFDADVCIAGFWVHVHGNNDGNNIHNRQIFSNSDDTKLFSMYDYPFLMTCHQSMWAKLYRSDLIKKIRFTETGGYIDGLFIMEVFHATNRLIALKEPVYYYRFDNPNASNSNDRHDKSLMLILDHWEKVRKFMKEMGTYDRFKEEFYFAISKGGLRFYQNISPKYKKEFFRKWRRFTKDLVGDSSFKFKYYEPWRKALLEKIIKNDYKGTLYESYTSHKFLSINFFEKFKNDNTVTINILGIPFFKRVNTPERKEKYLLGICYYRKTGNYKFSWGVKRKKDASSREISFLGMPIFSKTDSFTKYTIKLFTVPIFCKNKIAKNNQALAYTDHFSSLNKNLELIHRSSNMGIRQTYAAISAMQAAQTHPLLFSKYKHCFSDRDIVICGCGPTLLFYTPDKSRIHIGVNRAFEDERIEFDFLFAQDQFPEGMDKINNYRPGNCTKMYGWFCNERAREIQKNIRRILPSSFYQGHALRYILEDLIKGHWAVNIDLEPFGDFQGTVFSALQFACYTFPKRIFLVGFDCSSGHFVGSSSKNTGGFAYQMDSWKQFKSFSQLTYPEIGIISINPVGLRGLFHDVYTQPFLNQHPEIRTSQTEIFN